MLITFLINVIFFYREVVKTTGAKLIFSPMGDNQYFVDGCWSYKGKVGSVRGEDGQTINLIKRYVHLGEVMHEVMHSLGHIY